MRDTELQRLVLEELDWDPKVDASEVGVTVEEGIVTLSGDVGVTPRGTRASRRPSGSGASRPWWRTCGSTSPGPTPAPMKSWRGASWRRYDGTCPFPTSASSPRSRMVGSSWTEREAAEEAAWSAPGVTTVENELAVEVGPRVPEPACV